MNLLCYQIAGLLFLIALPAFAQNQVNYKQISTEEGLSHSTVNAILKDRNGFMWFGSLGGLNRYDGYRFYTFKHNAKDTTSLASDYISCLFEDRQGNLWVGTGGGGLSLYNADENTFLTFRESTSTSDISNDGITAISEDEDGNIWIGTYWGLNLLNRETYKFTQFYHAEGDPGSISGNSISSIVPDGNGNIWVGTHNSGLNLINTKTLISTRYTFDPGRPSGIGSNHISCLVLDVDNRLWIGTVDAGLIQFKDGQFTGCTPQTEGSEAHLSNILSVTDYGNGEILVSIENTGLSLYNSEKNLFRPYLSNSRGNFNVGMKSILSVYRDDKSTIWAGMASGGVVYFNENAASFELHQPRIPLVNAFAEDPGGVIWVGTDGGGIELLDLKNSQIVPLNSVYTKAALNNEVVVSLATGKDGNIWVGTYGGGVNFINRKSGKITYYDEGGGNKGLTDGRIYALAEDAKGNIWIGTLGGGVNVLNKTTGTFRTYLHDESSPVSIGNNSIRSIVRDQNDEIWIGTYGAGINLYNERDDNFIRYQNANSGLTSNVISTILVDGQNNLWVGTMGGGVNLFDREKKVFTAFTGSDGLSNDFVNGIQEDNDGNLWISTNKGLSKFNVATKHFMNFDKEDGLQGSEFRQGASLKTSGGKLFFGGVNGFNVFNPDDVSKDLSFPEVALTDFQIFNRPVEVKKKGSPLSKNIFDTEEITVSYDQSVLTFEFAALNYISASRNNYAYLLEGFDTGWNYVGSERRATYTNLDPGKYVFKVKASNSSGMWGENETAVTLIISPPFWKTWWFMSLSGMFLMGGFFSLYKGRVTAIEKRNYKLENQVRERTTALVQRNRDLEQFTYIVSHNLRSPVSNILGIADILQRANINEKEYPVFIDGLSKSANALDEVIADLNGILQLKSGADEKKEIVRFSHVFENVKMILSASIEKEQATVVADFSEIGEILSVKSYLTSIFYNLFSNSIKYRRRDVPLSVEVRSSAVEKNIELRFKDNGVGIDLAKKEGLLFGIYKRFHPGLAEGKGLGLFMVKTQVEMLGGSIKIVSEVNKGTEFIIELPKNNPLNIG